MAESMRPLTLGEILDRTAQLYRRNFALFAGTAAVPMAVILAAAVLLLPFGFVIRHGQPGNGQPGHAQVGIAGGAVIVIFSVIAVVAVIAGSVLSQGAITRAAVGLCNGQKLSVREALMSVRPRFWRYLLLMALQGLLAVGIPMGALIGLFAAVEFINRLPGSGMASGVASGALMGLAMLAAFAAIVWRGLGYALALSASIAEDKPAWLSIQRSVQLSKACRGRIFVMFLLVGAMAAVLSMIGYMPMLVLAVIVALAGHGAAYGATALVIGEIVNVLVNFAIQTLITPAYLIALVLFYYDQRIRLEGYDIEWMMQQAGLAPELAVASPQALPSALPTAPATVKEL